jgi:hypothetical protein
MKTKTVKLSLKKTTVKNLKAADVRSGLKAGGPRLHPECCYNGTGETHFLPTL